MNKRDTFTTTVFLSGAVLFLFILISFFFFPVRLVSTIYFLASLPQNLPLGIRQQPVLERNFQEQRLALETIVATVQTDELRTAGFNYWGLHGYTSPPARDISYRHLYRSMRRAHVQKVQRVSEKPFRVRLITDEVTATIEINVYGYLYTEGDRNDYFYGSRNKLDRNWYLFKYGY